MKIADIEEALKFARASPYGFVDTRNKSKKASFLSQNTPGELNRHKLFTARNGRIGFALNRKKDLQNVFNNSKFRGGGDEAMISAIKSGATTLDAFDPYLPRYYKRFGFVVAGRVPFNDQYAPQGWNYEKFGRPDVVLMVYKGGSRQTIEHRVDTFKPYQGEGKVFSSYDEAERAQKAEVRRAERMNR